MTFKLSSGFDRIHKLYRDNSNWQILSLLKYRGLFPFRKKAEISMGAKVEFPIGKKLFHLVVNPGTSLCPTVAAWNWYKLGETDKWNTKFRSGKQSHLFRFSTFSGNFPVGRTDETCSIYRRTRNSGNFD